MSDASAVRQALASGERGSVRFVHESRATNGEAVGEATDGWQSPGPALTATRGLRGSAWAVVGNWAEAIRAFADAPNRQFT